MKKGREAAVDIGRAWLAVIRCTISASPQQSGMPSPDGKCTKIDVRSLPRPLVFPKAFFQNSMAISPRQLAWCAHYHDQGTAMRGTVIKVRLRGAPPSYTAKAQASCLFPRRKGSHRK